MPKATLRSGAISAVALALTGMGMGYRASEPGHGESALRFVRRLEVLVQGADGKTVLNPDRGIGTVPIPAPLPADSLAS
ncbi:MAG: hypothetical protein M3N43_11350 [Actinomycetota bacterium]|nr:hypothetical protein [Actinomycetota bacterium]